MKSSSCKYQLIAGVTCCKAQQSCPPVACPNNIEDCPVYKKKE